MADDLGYTPGAGATVAADDIGGIHHQRMKLVIGANGVSDGDVASGNPLPVRETRPATGTVSSVAANASNVTLLASNAARLGATIYNDSDKIVYVKFAATATTSSFTAKVYPEGFFVLPSPVYTGIIDGIWEAGPTGSARITEMT